MGQDLHELLHFFPALAPDADRWNSDPGTNSVSMARYDHATFVIYEGVSTASGDADIYVEESSGSTGAWTKIGFRYRVMTNASDDWAAAATTATSTGFVIAGSTTITNRLTVIEVDARDLTDGRPWIRVSSTEATNAPADAAILGILSRPRYRQTTMPSAMSTST